MLISMKAVYVNLNVRFETDATDGKVRFDAEVVSLKCPVTDKVLTPVSKVTWDAFSAQDVRTEKYGKKTGYTLSSGKMAHFYKVWGMVSPAFAARLVPASEIDAGK